MKLNIKKISIIISIVTLFLVLFSFLLYKNREQITKTESIIAKKESIIQDISNYKNMDEEMINENNIQYDSIEK